MSIYIRAVLSVLMLVFVANCSREPEIELIGGVPADQIVDGYGVLSDGEYTLPPVPPEYLQGVNRRTIIPYEGDEAPGTIIVDRHAKFLFLVQDDGTAMRYPIAVGRTGLSLNNSSTVGMKREWPSWTPTQNMLRREPEVYGPFAEGVEGGLSNPLGARALYLFQNGRDTKFRIHGTNDMASIGNSGSAGCIRMFNHDVIDLYDRVEVGADVLIRSYEDSVAIEGEDLANRGVELPPTIVDPDVIYGTDDEDSETTDSVAEGTDTTAPEAEATETDAEAA